MISTRSYSRLLSFQIKEQTLINLLQIHFKAVLPHNPVKLIEMN